MITRSCYYDTVEITDSRYNDIVRLQTSYHDIVQITDSRYCDFVEITLVMILVRLQVLVMILVRLQTSHYDIVEITNCLLRYC